MALAVVAVAALVLAMPTLAPLPVGAAASSSPPRSPSPAQLLRLGPYLLADGEIFEGLDPVGAAASEGPRPGAGAHVSVGDHDAFLRQRRRGRPQ